MCSNLARLRFRDMPLWSHSFVVIFLLGLTALGHAQPAHGQQAQLANPYDGAVGVALRPVARWSAVAGAVAYRLQVGSRAPSGASLAADLFDSGRIGGTTSSLSELPANRWLYVRLWTQWSATNTWDYTDSTFQTESGTSARAVAQAAVFTYPTAGAKNVDTRQRFAWTGALGAQGYYLKIGTTAGNQDLYNSGEIPVDRGSCAVPALPIGKSLFARLWTKTNNSWVLFTDISFQALPRPAVFLTPKSGSLYVDSRLPFTWAAVAGGQGFRVQLGTTPGAADLMNSGELAATTNSFAVSPLPEGRKLYARLWTKAGGVWSLYTDISFQALARPATFLYPSDGAQSAEVGRAFTWTSVATAQGYYLKIGTERGANDLHDSGEMPARMTSRVVARLPYGRTLYARLWTKQSNVWVLYTDISFRTQSVFFTAPVHGATGVPATTTITWTTAPTVSGKAPIYQLNVGTAPGFTNVVQRLGLKAQSIKLLLPLARPLYARIQATLGDGTVLYDDIAFTTAGALAPTVTLVTPAESTQFIATASLDPVAMDVSRPFAWNSVAAALAYRLQIFPGMTPDAGATEPLRDSGTIHVPRMFFSDLPLGVYTGRIGVQLAAGWQWRSFTFKVTHNGANWSHQIQSALWATDYVRSMAATNNFPYRWTLLSEQALNWPGATCLDYRETLLDILAEMGLTAQFAAAQKPRRTNIAFQCYDVHALAEIYNSSDGRWVLLDPTFALVARRAADGRYASKEDVQRATLLQRWSDITYTPLGTFGTTLARDYYLDYPLLYLNLTPPMVGSDAGASVLPYLQEVLLPSARTAIYAMQSNVSPASIVLNGHVQNIDCRAEDQTSRLLGALSIAKAAGSPSALRVFSPRRYVFKGTW